MGKATERPAQRLYDLKDAAQYMGRSVWSMRELIWSGQLPFVRSGRKQYVDVLDLDAFIEKNKTCELDWERCSSERNMS